MKKKKINQLIDASGLKGFDFANKSVEVNWTVALHDDKMLARRTLTTDHNERIECFAVPYALLESTEGLYKQIIVDFVEVCSDVMASGFGADIGLFRDYAGANDPDLLELLSFFGRDYADFLNDIFYRYAVYQNTEVPMEGECDMDEEGGSIFTEEERFAQKVVSRLADMSLAVETDYGAIYWEFAKASGRIWYYRIDVEVDDECIYMNPCYGSINPDDEYSFASLRDVVLADLYEDSAESYEVDGGVFELLDLDIDVTT